MKQGIDVVICGGIRYGQEREYDTNEQCEADRPRILRERVSLLRHLNGLHLERGIRTLTTDGTVGAAALAGEWAQTLAVPVIPVRSDIRKYGAAAQVQRRKAILQAVLEIQAEGAVILVVSCPGGDREFETMAKARGLDVENVELVDLDALQNREVA